MATTGIPWASRPAPRPENPKILRTRRRGEEIGQMAILPAGIDGKAYGKVGGHVMSVARTRWGKLTTAREWVIPNDPQTADQLVRREILTRAAAHCNNVGAALYQPAWNNTLGLLPGWNSIMKYAIDNMEYSGGAYQWIDSPVGKSLGPCYMPDVVASHAGAAGSLDLTWDTSIVGDHCAAGDGLYGWVAYKDNPGSGNPTSFDLQTGSVLRSAGTVNISGLNDGEDYWYCVWMRHDEGDGTYTYSPVATGIEPCAS